MTFTQSVWNITLSDFEQPRARCQSPTHLSERTKPSVTGLPIYCQRLLHPSNGPKSSVTERQFCCQTSCRSDKWSSIPLGRIFDSVINLTAVPIKARIILSGRWRGCAPGVSPDVLLYGKFARRDHGSHALPQKTHLRIVGLCPLYGVCVAGSTTGTTS